MGEEERPKRPMNGYFRYRESVYADYKKKHADKPMIELSKVISEEYRNLPEERRAKFEKEYKAEMESYKKAKEEYDARHKGEKKAPRKNEERRERSRSKGRKGVAAKTVEKKKDRGAEQKSPAKRGRKKKE